VVRAGVLLLDDVIIVHHEPRSDGSRQMSEVGFVMPAHASALGKALLAFRPDDASRVLHGAPLRSMTGETIVEPAALSHHLEAVSRTGVAIEHDEAVLGEYSVAAPVLGEYSVAAPVFDATGLAVGALALVLPSSDWSPSAGPQDDVREAAHNLSRELGATGWPVYQFDNRPAASA
jgi:DNA-binding IclR family transcriptional regulator